MAGVYVPLVRQSYDFSCGAASLASCLYYWGIWSGREPELYEALDTTSAGTASQGIMDFAAALGLEVSYERNMSLERLRELGNLGYTVILSMQGWVAPELQGCLEEVWDDGHYVVFVGLMGEDIWMMDPAVAGNYHSIKVSEFTAAWHDWSDDGEEQEYHTGIIIKGKMAHPMNLPAID